MINRKAIVVFFTTFIVFSFYACAQNQGAGTSSGQEHYTQTAGNLQLKITIGERILYADLIDSNTTQDFIKQLPLSLSMQDINGREKYSSLPATLSTDGPVTATFQEGDIAYWLGGGLAVFYHQDNSTIKAGLIVIAKLKNGDEIFKGPDNLNVKFEAVKK